MDGLSGSDGSSNAGDNGTSRRLEFTAGFGRFLAGRRGGRVARRGDHGDIGRDGSGSEGPGKAVDVLQIVQIDISYGRVHSRTRCDAPYPASSLSIFVFSILSTEAMDNRVQLLKGDERGWEKVSDGGFVLVIELGMGGAGG